MAAASPRRAARTRCSTPTRGVGDAEGSVLSRSGVGPAFGRARLRAPSGSKPADAVVDRRRDEPVVVLGDEAVDPALEQRPQDRVEGVVRLTEVDLGTAVSEVLEPGAAFG